jgi:RNA-directed DNA polymerase
MHADGKSDDSVVPEKVLNKASKDVAEGLEGSGSIKENIGKSSMSLTQGREIVSHGLAGVREAAKKDKRVRFTALLHHVTERLLVDSFYALKKEAAPGVDRVRWGEYEQGLEDRIKDLHERVHRGSYRAQPSRRVYLLKPDGRQRPLGIAALEDKIVQQAVVTVLNQIYEEDFVGFSYGFRPGQGAHDALDALTVAIERRKVNWILDADIRGFFDNIDQERLMELVSLRIADPRILRLMRKWLKAGVSEEGEWSETKVGTPQGAVISPLLANIYLHYALDKWVIQWRRKNARGEVIIVRYADDFVMGFQDRAEAEQFLEQLRERLKAYGLELHSDKTRLIEFGRYAGPQRKRDGKGKPETFNFLGFTHIGGKRWKTGTFTVKRRTIGKRMTAKLKAISAELHQRMHEPIAEVGKWLTTVIRGYYNYHAVPGNLPRMGTFRQEVGRRWRRALERRSQRGRWSWERFKPLMTRYLPVPKVTHPYPLARFDATHPR